MSEETVIEILGQSVCYQTTSYKGDVFDRFFVRRNPGQAPGWFVFGRNEKYNDRYVMLVARPNVNPMRYRGWNAKTRRGWRTRRDAQAICDALLAQNGPKNPPEIETDSIPSLNGPQDHQEVRQS